MIYPSKCPKCDEVKKVYGKGMLVCKCNKDELVRRDYENQGKRD